MLPRWKCTLGLLLLAGSATLLAPSCSDSGRRDQNYGTDVGVGFVPQPINDDAGQSEAPGSAGDATDDDGGMTAMDSEGTTDTASKENDAPVSAPDSEATPNPDVAETGSP